MMVGQASAFQPNYNKAVIAAGRIFKLLDRKPQIDSASGDNATGLRLVSENIHFSYLLPESLYVTLYYCYHQKNIYMSFIGYC